MIWYFLLIVVVALGLAALVQMKVSEQLNRFWDPTEIAEHDRRVEAEFGWDRPRPWQR